MYKFNLIKLAVACALLAGSAHADADFSFLKDGRFRKSNQLIDLNGLTTQQDADALKLSLNDIYAFIHRYTAQAHSQNIVLTRDHYAAFRLKESVTKQGLSALRFPQQVADKQPFYMWRIGEIKIDASEITLSITWASVNASKEYGLYQDRYVFVKDQTWKFDHYAWDQPKKCPPEKTTKSPNYFWTCQDW